MRYIYLSVLLIYRIGLEQNYLVVAQSGWAGFHFHSVSVIDQLTSYGVLLTLGFLVPLSCRRPSQYIVVLLFSLSYVPITALYPLADESTLPGLLAISIAFAILLRMDGSWIGFMRGGMPLTRPSLIFLLISLVIVMTLAMIGHFGLHLNFPDLADVYGLREMHTMQSTRGWGYLVAWLAKVVNPMLLVLALYRKQWWLVAVTIAVQILIFNTTGLKTIFFGLILVGGLYGLVSWFKERFALSIVLTCTLGIAGISAYFQMLPDTGKLLYSLLVRRIFLVPGSLYYKYLEYFSEHGLIYFSDRLPFSLFLSYPFSNTPPKLIGAHYYGSSEVSANANIFADGFANAGYSGFIIVCVMLYGLFFFLDNLSHKKDLRIVVPLLAIPSYAMINTSLPTILVTHGLVLGVVLIALLPSKLCSERITRIE
ncbi:MAG: hypothetical protein HQL54_08430 [Magnetococcales bacterium]|nr:hypothetical protein [Magnetococcales bacterium]